MAAEDPPPLIDLAFVRLVALRAALAGAGLALTAAVVEAILRAALGPITVLPSDLFSYGASRWLLPWLGLLGVATAPLVVLERRPPSPAGRERDGASAFVLGSLAALVGGVLAGLLGLYLVQLVDGSGVAAALQQLWNVHVRILWHAPWVVGTRELPVALACGVVVASRRLGWGPGAQVAAGAVGAAVLALAVSEPWLHARVVARIPIRPGLELELTPLVLSPGLTSGPLADQVRGIVRWNILGLAAGVGLLLPPLWAAADALAARWWPPDPGVPRFPIVGLRR